MAKSGFITNKYGIFLGNMYDPLNLDVDWPTTYCNHGESELQSRARLSKWMTTKTIGPPIASPHYEEADLRSMGLVGVFFNEDNDDTYRSAEEVSLTFPGGRLDVEWMGHAIKEVYEERHKDD